MDVTLKKKGAGKMFWCVFLPLIFILADQLAKLAVNYFVKDNTVQIIPNFMNIINTKNPGFAFGIGKGVMWFVNILTPVLCIVIAYFLKDFDLQNKPLTSLGLCMLLAGAIGNFIDRIIYKEVTDFLDFIIFNHHFPTFNIADTCVVIGAVLLAIGMIKQNG